MEFITVEQFKEQSIEVQKVFLDWWNPSIGDIYCNEHLVNFEGDKIQRLEVITNTTDINHIKQDSRLLCALLTEGQLRKFTEDKAGCLLDIIIENLNNDYYLYTVIGWKIKEFEYGKEFGRILFEDCIEAEDLLLAYWKVACSVAKEELNG